MATQHGLVVDDLARLAELMSTPPRELPGRLSEFLSRFVAHTGLLVLAADTSGGRREGVGDPAFVEGASFLELDQLRRIILLPGTSRRAELTDRTGVRATLQVLSGNGALLVLADPAHDAADELVLQLWNVVALRAQELADAASPDYLVLARAASGVRMEALTELADEYSTTLESMLAALRSSSLDDRASRQRAIGIAAEGLVQLRTASDRVRTFTEEPVTTAFQRLRDDLRPLVHYRDLQVQFVEPPVDGRPLPSEVAHGARAVVRASILALLDVPEVRRIRVQWDCDGTNLLIDMRDDGPGVLSEESTQLQLLRQRVHALDGRLTLDATPGWGTEMSIVIPLDPPHPAGTGASTWELRPREAEVLELLAAGRRNKAIAAELGISDNTVKFHVSRILRGMGAASRAEAVAMLLAARAAR